MAYAKIRPRRATLAEWTMCNPIIAEGELVVEHPNTGIGTGPVRFKIGDGFKPYNDLPYAFDAMAANAIYGGNVYDWHDIIIRSDSYDNWMSEDPILALGEISYDKTHKKIKVGDGTTPWSKLGYIGPDFNHGDYDFGDEDQIRDDLANGIPPKEPTPANVVYRPRRGKLDTIINPDTVLRSGEMFFEIPPEGMGKNYCRVKIGDGVTPYSKLHYAIDPWNCYVKDLPNEPLMFDDTLTDENIEPLLDKIKSKAGMAQLIENIKACLVWLKTKHNSLKESYDLFYQNVITNYLTKDEATNMYLTKIDASKIYLTQDYASTHYVTFNGVEDLTNKTYEGYTLDDACEYEVSDASKAKIFSDSDGDHLITERRAYFGTPKFNNRHDYDSNTNYHVHTTMKNSKSTGEDSVYGAFISVSGGVEESDRPVWGNPKDIRVGWATHAYKDSQGNSFAEYWRKLSEIEGSIPSNEDIAEIVRKLLPGSLITPLSYHRTMHGKRNENNIGEVSGSNVGKCWFTVKVPNAQIPYVDTTGNAITLSKINELEGASELNNSMLLIVAVQNSLTGTDGKTKRLDCIRVDVVTWSPEPNKTKYPSYTSDSGKRLHSRPRRKTIFTVGYATKKIWDINWVHSEHESGCYCTKKFTGSEFPGDIVYREAKIWVTASNKDTSIYVYRLDAGFQNMLYNDMNPLGTKIEPVGNRVKR